MKNQSGTWTTTNSPEQLPLSESDDPKRLILDLPIKTPHVRLLERSHQRASHRIRNVIVSAGRLAIDSVLLECSRGHSPPEAALRLQGLIKS